MVKQLLCIALYLTSQRLLAVSFALLLTIALDAHFFLSDITLSMDVNKDNELTDLHGMKIFDNEVTMSCNIAMSLFVAIIEP